MEKESIVIGFAGGIGGGKSTLAARIEKAFGDDATIIYMDHFRKYQPESIAEGMLIIPNAPDEFNIDLMVRCVSELKSGKDSPFPIYGFSSFSDEDRPWVTIKTKPIIILNGELLFAIPEIRDLIDIKVYVDIDADVRIMRRIHTQVAQNKLSLDDFIEQYITDDKPAHDTYVEPSKKYADIIIPEGAYNSIAREMLVCMLRERLRAYKTSD